MSTAEKVAMAESAGEGYGLPAVLSVLELPRSNWYYHQKYVKAYTEKYAHLQEPLEAIARALDIENPPFRVDTAVGEEKDFRRPCRDSNAEPLD